MELYTKDNSKLTYNKISKIGENRYGNVYHINDGTCLKLLKDSTQDINIETLTQIKELNLQNFYKLYEYIYDINNNFIGYTMEYYPKENIDILTMPIEYTLDNLIKIYNSIVALSNKSIISQDLKEDNTIMNRNQITVIDTDLYYKSFCMSAYEALKENTKILYELFKEIYLKALEDFYKGSNLSKESIERLFFTIGDTTPDRVCKKLVKYKYPIDYIKEYDRF